MCDQKIEGTDGICVNRQCEHHILTNELGLDNANMQSDVVWAFQGCMCNLDVLREFNRMDGFSDGEGLVLEAIGQAWGVSRQRIKQIEIVAIGKFRSNYKSMYKEEDDYGKDSTERPRAVRVTGSGRLSVSGQEG